MEFWIWATAIVAALAAAAAVWRWAARRSRRGPGKNPRGAAERRPGWSLGLGRLLSRFRGVDEEYMREMERTLLGADLGPAMTSRILDRVREAAPRGPDELRNLVGRELVGALSERERGLRLSGSPATVVLVGVNGSGKTTTAAKLAARLTGEGWSCLLAAADTFRAAAGDQLRTWGGRLGVEVVTGAAGGDPAAVAYDALAAGRARGAEAVLVDTAGRLHESRNLMQELAKIVRVLERDGQPVSEVLLVIDASTGRNGLAQARVFTEQAGVTGIVLTKMDGTAKGGTVVAVEHDLGIPVKFIGVGEGPEDLLPFQADFFAEGLLE